MIISAVAAAAWETTASFSFLRLEIIICCNLQVLVVLLFPESERNLLSVDKLLNTRAIIANKRIDHRPASKNNKSGLSISIHFIQLNWSYTNICKFYPKRTQMLHFINSILFLNLHRQRTNSTRMLNLATAAAAPAIEISVFSVDFWPLTINKALNLKAAN